MGKILFSNVGTIFTGDIENPIADADSILIVDKNIAEIGKGLKADSETKVFDVQGASITPGLIDSHVHVAIGEWTPRASSMNWMAAYAKAGITGLISAGETHVPNRPRNAVGVKALATLAYFISQKTRPAGAKVYGGAIIPEIGLTEDDIKELAEMGIKHTGEYGLGAAIDPAVAGPMAEWFRKYGIRSMSHTGATYLAGTSEMDADRLLAIKPDVLCHIPTMIPTEGIRRLLDQTPAKVEICAVNKFSPRDCCELIELLRERDAYDRLMFGTDSPSGFGIYPHGVWEVITMLTGMCDLEPEIAIACGSGNTSKFYGINANMIKVGYSADLVLCDAPVGCVQNTVYDCLKAGTEPGIGLVMIDGEVTAEGSGVNAAPPKRAIIKQ
jgi:enamidase